MGHHHRKNRANHEHWQHNHNLGPDRPGKRAQLPKHDLLTTGSVGKEQNKGKARLGEGVDGDAGEQQGDHLRATSRSRDGIDQQGGQQATHKCKKCNATAPGRDAKHNCGRGAKSSPRRDTHNAGFCQRVTKDRLHESARNGKRRPYRQGHHDSWEAHHLQGGANDRVFGGEGCVDTEPAQNRPDHFARGDGELTGHRRDEDGSHQNNHEAEGEYDAAGSAAMRLGNAHGTL